MWRFFENMTGRRRRLGRCEFLLLVERPRVYEKDFSGLKSRLQLECGPMLNVATLPNIGDALYLTPQTLADADY